MSLLLKHCSGFSVGAGGTAGEPERQSGFAPGDQPGGADGHRRAGGADALGGFRPDPDRGYTLVALVAGDGTGAREGGADLVVSLPFDPGTFVSELLAGMKA